ncbi:MAG: glycerol-3-phosphate dehydrogenase [Pseudomonadota bacterium]|jgi:glycerol-3-phosphate dehydrogenase (NAD(P)+)
MNMNISVIGAGAWGTAMAISLSSQHHVTLYARNAKQIEAMQATRVNRAYLPDITLPAALTLSADLISAVANAELIILAAPLAALRSTLKALPSLSDKVGVVWLCKGLEANSGLLPHQVVAEELADSVPRAVLSGPSFALEVAKGLPTALTLASSDAEFARHTAKALRAPHLRVYASTDVVGVEIGGAVKNVLAIAAGISDGMGLGLNARAALMTRGLAEISRLGVALGGRAETLMGLSGAGDLILTCTGDLSRNRQVGLLLTQQHSLPEIMRRLGHVAEGVYSVREVYQLSRRLSVAMPICAAVYRIIYEHVPVKEVLAELLNRPVHSEFDQ